MIAERVDRIRARHKLSQRRAPEWPVPSVFEDQLELFSSEELFSSGAKRPGAVGQPGTLQRKVNRV